MHQIINKVVQCTQTAVLSHFSFLGLFHIQFVFQSFTLNGAKKSFHVSNKTKTCLLKFLKTNTVFANDRHPNQWPIHKLETAGVDIHSRAYRIRCTGQHSVFSIFFQIKCFVAAQPITHTTENRTRPSLSPIALTTARNATKPQTPHIPHFFIVPLRPKMPALLWRWIHEQCPHNRNSRNNSRKPPRHDKLTARSDTPTYTPTSLQPPPAA
jgi:hypothetical protein